MLSTLTRGDQGVGPDLRKGTVRPGWLAKLLELSRMLLPRWGRVRMMGVALGGMTKRA
jgi:hypothetical protein